MSSVAIEFPPINHVTEWPALFFEGTPFEVNKVVLLMWASVVIVFAFFFVAGRQRSLVPAGVQNVAEAAVGLVRDGIIMQTIGPDGLPWLPFMMTLFSFIFVGNLWEVIPGAQMPTNARIAFPALMAIAVWVLYHVVGIRSQGLFGYLRSNMFPPGVPKAMYVLLTPMHTVTFLITQPLSLAVRLFANMLAGHLLLVSFATITAGVFVAGPVATIWPLSFAMLVVLTGFEVLVAFLQAFIFTMLAALYVGTAKHPNH